jgi:hypothetical protein
MLDKLEDMLGEVQSISGNVTAAQCLSLYPHAEDGE